MSSSQHATPRASDRRRRSERSADRGGGASARSEGGRPPPAPKAAAGCDSSRPRATSSATAADDDDGELPSPSTSARRSPQLHPITGEPPSKRKAAARSLRPLQPVNRPGSAGLLTLVGEGILGAGAAGCADGESERRRPSSARPTSPQETEARELKKFYAARVNYTKERDTRKESEDDAARQETARVASALVQATRAAAASEHAEQIRQYHAASVIQAAERCRSRCDAFIEMRWAAMMIQRIERGRRGRRSRRLLEKPPWLAPGMGLAPGLMAAAGDGGDATAGALWRMLFHTAATFAAMRAKELRERDEGPWGARGTWNGTAGVFAAGVDVGVDVDVEVEEAEPLELQPEPELGPEPEMGNMKTDYMEDAGRGSNFQATLKLRSLAAEAEEQARMEATERSRKEAAEARAAVQARRKSEAEEQASADADKIARRRARATQHGQAAWTVQGQWRARQRGIAADQTIWNATTTVQAAWRGRALRAQLQWVHSVATLVQANARGWLVRRQLSEIRQLERRAAKVKAERARIAAAMAEALGEGGSVGGFGESTDPLGFTSFLPDEADVLADEWGQPDTPVDAAGVVVGDGPAEEVDDSAAEDGGNDEVRDDDADAPPVAVAEGGVGQARKDTAGSEESSDDSESDSNERSSPPPAQRPDYVFSDDSESDDSSDDWLFGGEKYESRPIQSEGSEPEPESELQPEPEPESYEYEPEPALPPDTELSPEELAARESEEAARTEAIERSREEARQARRAKKAAADAKILKASQAARVASLRAEKEREGAEAAATVAMVSRIADRLERDLVAGRSFVEVLEKVGVTVSLDDVEFGGDEEEQVVAKAVRRALIKFHPDRAVQKGLGVEETLEATETYKLLQNLHGEWLEERESLQDGLAQVHAEEEARRHDERVRAKAVRKEARRRAEQLAAEELEREMKREAKRDRHAARLAKKQAQEAAKRDKQMSEAARGVQASTGRAATNLEELKRQIDAFDDDLSGHMKDCHAEAAARRKGVNESVHRAPPSAKAQRREQEAARAEAARQQEAEIARERAGLFTGVDGVEYAQGGVGGARARAREGLRKEVKQTEREHLWDKVRKAREKKQRKASKKSGEKKSARGDRGVDFSV